MVVHSPRRRHEGHQPDPGQADQPVGVTPTLSADAAITAAGVHFGTQFDAVPTASLVVYAARANPELAYDVLYVGNAKDGTPMRMHYYVDAVNGAILAKEDAVQDRHAAGRPLRHRQPADPAGRHAGDRHWPLAVRRRGPAVHAVERDPPPLRDEGSDPRQHLHHRHGQRLPWHRHAGGRWRQQVGQRHADRSREHRRGCGLRLRQDLGLLQEHLRPRRHPRRRRRRDRRGALLAELRQRLLERRLLLHGLRRRRRHHRPSAGGDRHRRPRSEPRRDPRHRRPDLRQASRAA